MKARTLPIDIHRSDLTRELFHTTSLLRAYPFLPDKVAPIEALYAEWIKLEQEELALERALLDAEARAMVLDDGFDFLCVAINATLLAESGGNRKSPLYQRYFGAAPPSKLKRPVLGEQLEVMRTWPPSLMSTSSPALKAYGTQLAALVIEADKVVLALAEAKRKRADFDIGPRKAFIDTLNAARQVLYGQLAEIPHKHPERNLPRDFATRFFLRSEGARKPTVAEVEHTILRLREKLHKQEELLARLIEQEEEEARLREDAEVAAAENALAEAQQQAAEAAERLAALRAQRR